MLKENVEIVKLSIYKEDITFSAYTYNTGDCIKILSINMRDYRNTENMQAKKYSYSN